MKKKKFEVSLQYDENLDRDDWSRIEKCTAREKCNAECAICMYGRRNKSIYNRHMEGLKNEEEKV